MEKRGANATLEKLFLDAQNRFNGDKVCHGSGRLMHNVFRISELAASTR